MAKRQFDLFKKMGEPTKFALDMSEAPESTVNEFLNTCGLKLKRCIQFGKNIDMEPFYCIVEAEKSPIHKSTQKVAL